MMLSFEIVLMEWETTQADRRRGGRGDTVRVHARRCLPTGTGLDGEILTRIHFLCLAIVTALQVIERRNGSSPVEYLVDHDKLNGRQF